MSSIYCTGAVTDFDDPPGWQAPLEEYYTTHEFINPYELNDFEMGDDAIYERPDEVVEPALDALADIDGMLLRWEDDSLPVGSVIEAWVASYTHEKPVVVWYEGWRDNLTPWLQYCTKGDWSDVNKCVTVLELLIGEDGVI